MDISSSEHSDSNDTSDDERGSSVVASGSLTKDVPQPRPPATIRTELSEGEEEKIKAFCRGSSMTYQERRAKITSTYGITWRHAERLMAAFKPPKKQPKHAQHLSWREKEEIKAKWRNNPDPEDYNTICNEIMNHYNISKSYAYNLRKLFQPPVERGKPRKGDNQRSLQKIKAASKLSGEPGKPRKLPKKLFEADEEAIKALLRAKSHDTLEWSTPLASLVDSTYLTLRDKIVRGYDISERYVDRLQAASKRSTQKIQGQPQPQGRGKEQIYAVIIRINPAYSGVSNGGVRAIAEFNDPEFQNTYIPTDETDEHDTAAAYARNAIQLQFDLPSNDIRALHAAFQVDRDESTAPLRNMLQAHVEERVGQLDADARESGNISTEPPRVATHGGVPPGSTAASSSMQSGSTAGKRTRDTAGLDTPPRSDSNVGSLGISRLWEETGTDKEETNFLKRMKGHLEAINSTDADEDTRSREKLQLRALIVAEESQAPLTQLIKTGKISQEMLVALGDVVHEYEDTRKLVLQDRVVANALGIALEGRLFPYEHQGHNHIFRSDDGAMQRVLYDEGLIDKDIWEKHIAEGSVNGIPVRFLPRNQPGNQVEYVRTATPIDPQSPALREETNPFPFSDFIYSRPQSPASGAQEASAAERSPSRSSSSSSSSSNAGRLLRSLSAGSSSKASSNPGGSREPSMGPHPGR